MRFLIMVKATPDSEAGRPPSPALMAGMGRLSEEMARKGVLLSSEGLQPSSKGARLHYSGGKRAVIDGPFAEAREVVGGFAILRAESRAEAIALADRLVDVHVEAGVPEVEVEIRPLFEPSDFGPPPGA